MTEEDLAELARATQELRLKQETPDPPEALRSVPSLSLHDIPKEPIHVPTQVIVTFSVFCLVCSSVESLPNILMRTVGWRYQWSKSFAA
jgi:Zn-dependent M16 (insulinase) family peptidase